MKLDKKAGVGNLYCKVCGQKFQTGINYLSAAVDVYSDWVDACEDVAKNAAEEDAEDAKFSSYATGGEVDIHAAGGDVAIRTGPVARGAAANDEDEDGDYE